MRLMKVFNVQVMRKFIGGQIDSNVQFIVHIQLNQTNVCKGSCLVHNVLRFKELRQNYIVIKKQMKKKQKKNKEKMQIDTSFNHTSSNLYVIFFFTEFPEPSVQG